MEACISLLSTCIPKICLQPQRLGLAVAPVQTRPLRVHVSCLGGRSNNYCRGGGRRLYTPLQVTSPAGKYLSTLLQDENHAYFESAVKGQLIRLSDDHKRTTQLMNTIDPDGDNDEAKLCQSVTEGVKREIGLEVEEAMYILICRKFFETGVAMMPRISDCIVNGRLELSTSKDCQLEYVHTPDALEFVKLYITRVTELGADVSVRDDWKLIEIDPSYFLIIYTFALLDGRFLKSASSRYALELLFHDAREPMCQKTSFRSYATGFTPDLKFTHSLPKSFESKNMMNKHLKALFSQVETRPASTKGFVTTSPGTLRRLALEGFAFGSFLWDTEYFVNKFYKLEDDDKEWMPGF